MTPGLRLCGSSLAKSLHSYSRSQSNVKYDPKFVTSAVWDLSSTSGLPPTLPAGTVDVAIMIFVLSALHPNEWAQAVRNAWDVSMQ